MNIQWYPGHMAKARRLLKEQLQVVDLVLEIRDARIPRSSANGELAQLIGNKPRIIVLNKEDLADPALTEAWVRILEEDVQAVIPFNSLAPKGGTARVMDACRRSALKTMETRKRKGLRPRAVRAMVIGIPNVGKSSLINGLVRKGSARTGNKPGVTRGNQWVRILKDLELMDTPGILWPKFESETTGERLAFTGAISERIFDVEEAGRLLAAALADRAPGALTGVYGELDLTVSPEELLLQIGRNRSFLGKDGEVTIDRTALKLLHDYQAGRLGRITLDLPGEEER